MLTRARDNVTWPTVIALVVLALLPAILTGASAQSVLVQAMIYATGAVGLDLLTGYSGQFSFGQFVYFAVGAYTMTGLRVHAGWPWVWAVVAAVVAAGVLAAVVASAMVRLRFFGSSVGTFFLGAVAFDLLNGPRLAGFTGGSNGIAVPPVSIGSLSLNLGPGLYGTALVALALASALCLRYTKVRAGVAARVVKENEVVAAVLGIRVVTEKVRAQVVAGMAAGLGGCVLALNLGYLSPETFNVTQSIELFAIVAVGGAGSIVGAIVGAVFFFGFTNLFSSSGAVAQLVFALILLAVVVFLNRGLYDLIERGARAVLWFLRGRGVRSLGERGDVPPVEPAVTAAGPVGGLEAMEPHAVDLTEIGAAGIAEELAALTRAHHREVPRGDARGIDNLLTVEDLGVTFGGVRALDGVSLSVGRGEVHAIIGPNGAGKTTLLNCISGIQPSTGRIILDQQDLAGLSVSARRQQGVARTFQHPSLVADLDALANVRIGAYATHAASVLAELLALPGARRRRREAREGAIGALRSLEFPQARWHVLAGDLTMGEQKHVDIARAMSGRPRLLLLDEPTAGLGVEEVGAVAHAIKAVRDSGVTIVVIAHHVGFIRQVADRCTVLDFGKVLKTGTPSEVLEDPTVVEVFVGTGAKQ